MTLTRVLYHRKKSMTGIKFAIKIPEPYASQIFEPLPTRRVLEIRGSQVPKHLCDVRVAVLQRGIETLYDVNGRNILGTVTFALGKQIRFEDLKALQSQHKIRPQHLAHFLDKRYLYSWQIIDPQRFETPIPYVGTLSKVWETIQMKQLKFPSLVRQVDAAAL